MYCSRRVLSLAFVFATTPLAAQAVTAPAVKLGPRSFFPREYTTEYYVDVDALQDTVVWDVFERSIVAGYVRTAFRKQFGFRIENLTQLRAGERFVGEGEKNAIGSRVVGVTVLEGRKVCLPPADSDDPTVQSVAETIAGHPVVRRSSSFWPEPRLSVVPVPGCLVVGSDEMIRSVLKGDRRGGVLDGKLMPLTAMRKPLAYVAVGFPPVDDPSYETAVPFEAGWLHEDDPVRHGLLRMDYDPKTEKITFRGTVRFEHGKKGPETLRDGIQASLKGPIGTTLIPLKDLAARIDWKIDGADLHATLEMSEEDLASWFGPTGLLGMFVYTLAQPMPMPVAAPAPVRAVPLRPAKPAKPVKPGKREKSESKGSSEKRLR